MHGEASSKGMGFRPGGEDSRDYKLRAYIGRLEAPTTKGSRFYWNPMRLDQGREGSCVGHGWTQAVNSTPKVHRYTHEDAVGLYNRARQLDEWEGEDYEGTSVRAGGQACREKDLIKNFAYAANIEEVALWILNSGPVVIGVDWYEGMGEAEKGDDYFIEPTGRVRGGHCVCLDGIRYKGNDRDYVRGLNSWSDDWGYDGRFRMKLSDLEKLLSDPNAAACTYVEA